MYIGEATNHCGFHNAYCLPIHRRPPCMMPLRSYSTWTWWSRSPSGCTRQYHGRNESFIPHKRRNLYPILLETRKAVCMQGVRVYLYEFQSGNTHKMNADSAIAGKSADSKLWLNLCVNYSVHIASFGQTIIVQFVHKRSLWLAKVGVCPESNKAV